MGNTQAYNAILAKARAMYGRRLTAQNYQDLLTCRDLPELINYLKSRTPYINALQETNSLITRRAQLEALLKQNLFERYATLCRYEMTIGHEFYRYFIMYSEIQQIRTRLQELHSCETGVALHSMPAFIQKHSKLNLNAIAQAQDIKMLVWALEGTAYAKVLAATVEKPGFSLEANGLLELEAALERYVYDELEQITTKTMKGKQQKEMLYLLRRQSDLKAIADIYRLKDVLHADAAFIKKRVCIDVSNMSEKQWLYLMDAASAKDVLHRLVETPYANELYGTSFNYIEEGVRKVDFAWHLKQLRFSTNPTVVLFCYVFLAENELTNVIHIIEAVRYSLTPDQIGQMLVGVGD